MKVRISSAFYGYLSGSSLFQQGEEAHGYGPEGTDLVAKYRAASARKDGSRTIEVDAIQADILADYAEIMIEGARDNVSIDFAESMREINAGNAVLRQIAKAVSA